MTEIAKWDKSPSQDTCRRLAMEVRFKIFGKLVDPNSFQDNANRFVPAIEAIYKELKEQEGLIVDDFHLALFEQIALCILGVTVKELKGQPLAALHNRLSKEKVDAAFDTQTLVKVVRQHLEEQSAE